MSLFFVMNRFGVLCTFVYQFPYSLNIYICDILLNWDYLFKMGCYNLRKFVCFFIFVTIQGMKNGDVTFYILDQMQSFTNESPVLCNHENILTKTIIMPNLSIDNIHLKGLN